MISETGMLMIANNLESRADSAHWANDDLRMDPREVYALASDIKAFVRGSARPTCRNLTLKPADELLCSACGEHVDIAYVESCEDYHARYCPHCGRKVVRDGD